MYMLQVSFNLYEFLHYFCNFRHLLAQIGGLTGFKSLSVPYCEFEFFYGPFFCVLGNNGCINTAYQMRVGSILNLSKLNIMRASGKHSTSSINLIMNLHNFAIQFITCNKNELLIIKKRSFFSNTPIV